MDILDIARFWSSVDVQHHSKCWLWRKHRRPWGYGDFKLRHGVTAAAHRVAYELATGEPLQPEIVVRHKCDNPACCNPKHLETGTHSDNVRDRVLRRRSAIGVHNGRALLKPEQVMEIWSRPRGVTAAQMGERFGVTRHTVEAIWGGRAWAHLTGGKNLLRGNSNG